MVYSVNVYYNTGFNTTDIPFSPALLEVTAQVRTFENVWLLQNKGVARLKIKATWEDIDGADYVSLSSAEKQVFYFINNITMLNQNTAQLDLTLDALTTIGIMNLVITGGWCTRRHVKDDEPFKYTIPESFTPQEELVIDAGQELKLPSIVNDVEMTLIGCTFYLLGDYKMADFYYTEDVEGEEAEKLAVGVPRCPLYPENISNETIVEMDVGDQKSYTNTLPGLKLYSVQDNLIEKLTQAQSLNFTDGITASYRIPSEYFNQAPTLEELLTTGYNKIKNRTGVVETTLNYEYYTPLNNKVYAQFNNYSLHSLCSGDAIEFEASELYVEGKEAPSFLIWADVSPGGCPYCRPEYYKGNNTDIWLNCIKGMPWQNTPIILGKSGSMLDYQDYLLNSRKFTTKSLRTNINNAASMLDFAGMGSGLGLQGYEYTGQKRVMNSGGIFSHLEDTPMMGGFLSPGMIANMARTLGNVATSGIDLQTEKMQLNAALNRQGGYVAPEVRFPRDNSIQNFIGNTFWVLRTRLSINDAKRFDQYLSMFGYAVDEPLTLDAFHCRKNYNFVQATGVTLGNDESLWMRQLAASQLNGGVRVWYTNVNYEKYTQENPVVTEGGESPSVL